MHVLQRFEQRKGLYTFITILCAMLNTITLCPRRHAMPSNIYKTPSTAGPGYLY
jgi:hypothetical protein